MYSPGDIEPKWQKYWKERGIFKDYSRKETFYVLDMFPYPSGAGLHVGHPKGYIATDVVARMKHLQGYSVLHPMGWDAFGLPAENYAIKNKVHPRVAVEHNIATFKAQLAKIGFTYDWDREVTTTDSDYYCWTQWIFLQLYKEGLAYESEEPVNWCPVDKTVLANEDLENGKCERCGSPVQQRRLRQWVLRMTAYADRLLEDLDKEQLDWPEYIKEQQRNWIGRSEGAEVEFALDPNMLSGDVVFASNNKGKVKRMRMLLKRAGIMLALKTPEELGIKSFDVAEDGATIKENAEKKARVLAALTDLPVLADDSGFFIEGTKIDPVTVKRNALNGFDEKTLSIEQIAERMQEYYKNVALSHGGRVDAEWRNALCLITRTKSVMHAEAIRPVILTAESRGAVDPYLPLRGLYISKATGNYVLEQTDEEEFRELQPITDALKNLFARSVRIFTTRVDTLPSGTFIVISPELAQKWLDVGWQASEEVKEYVKNSLGKRELDRLEQAKGKTGVFAGMHVVNPLTNQDMQVWIADFVLGNYGTGAVFADAHDQRDFEFAKKYGIPLKTNIKPLEGDDAKIRNLDECFTGEGTLYNSGKYDGLDSASARLAIVKDLQVKGIAYARVNYKMRDWVFSRQRYWGEPIPLIHCATCGVVPVPEDQLPVRLPDVEHYEPTDTGESPLAAIVEWVNVACPKCGGPGKRETNTMPQWAGSCWYYLRYIDPKNSQALVDKNLEKKWMPVDLYVGGAEHATRHLLYARFWHKFLYDIGAVSTVEPFTKLVNVGLILAEDGRKMSKRWNNVVNPDDVIAEYGADALRLYEMFMGPFTQSIAWSTNGLVGARRFLDRVVAYASRGFASTSDRPSAKLVDHAVKKVGEDITHLHFNTAVSALMIALNGLEKAGPVSRDVFEKFVLILSPFAPHVAEELWQMLGHEESLYAARWPEYDPALLVDETLTLPVQVNGKVRDLVTIARDATQEDALAAAKASPSVARHLGNDPIRKIVYIPGKMLNIVIG